jgi:hypothetical protein
MSSIAVITWAAVLTLVVLTGPVPARAQGNPPNYTFLIATGFLCDSGDSSACPAVVKSANGESYELTGVGTLSPESKSVTAAGTFTHKSTGGVALETGVWLAYELVSFDSYGIAPGALTREGRALGPMQLGSPHIGLSQFGPRGMGVFSAPMAAGGLAVLRIRLLPVLGFARNATLQVNCALGKVPSERAVEGIRLAVEGGGAEFDEEISGRALFLLDRFATNAVAKAPTPDAETKPAAVEDQQ